MPNNTQLTTNVEFRDELFEVLTLIEHSLCICDIMQNDYFLPSKPNPNILVHYYEQNQILSHIIFDNTFRAKSGLNELLNKFENITTNPLQN